MEGGGGGGEGGGCVSIVFCAKLPMDAVCQGFLGRLWGERGRGFRLAAVGGPACRTSQSTVIVRSPSASRLMAARKDLPISRCIS